MIAIIDYGLSNLLSIKRAADLFDEDNIVTNDFKDLLKADKIILPGVGAFHYGMDQLRKYEIDKTLKETTEKGIPLLGICLGMQMLFEASEEGGYYEGLGLINGSVVKISGLDKNGNQQDVPHIGWEALIRESINPDFSDILENVELDEEVYFVHSYEGKTEKKINNVADIVYGGRKVCAIVQHKNVVGCQFHPEKSGRAGLKILKNFIANF